LGNTTADFYSRVAWTEIVAMETVSLVIWIIGALIRTQQHSPSQSNGLADIYRHTRKLKIIQSVNLLYKMSEATLFSEPPNLTPESGYGSNSLPRGLEEGIVQQDTPLTWATVGLLRHEIAELRSSLGTQSAAIERLQSEKQQQDETIRTQTAEIARLKESVAKLKESVAKLNDIVMKQSAEISRLMKANEELQAQVKYLFAVVNKQDTELSALRRVGFSIARAVKFLLVKKTKSKRPDRMIREIEPYFVHLQEQMNNSGKLHFRYRST
jgi:hypothetical protein